MKKVVISFIIVCLLIMHIPLVKAENKVKVYMFTKSGCPACETAYEYFNGVLEKEPDLFELVTLQVWNGEDSQGNWLLASEDLLNLMRKSLEYFDEDTDKLKTPTIAVGDYLQVGAGDMEDFYDRIVELKNSDKPVDRISEIAKKEKIDIDKLKGIKEENKDEDGKYDIYVLIGIFVFLIGGFGALYLFGRKK